MPQASPTPSSTKSKRASSEGRASANRAAARAFADEAPLPFEADASRAVPDHNSRTRLKGAFEISTTLLRADPAQPRQQFAAEKIDAMAASIKSRGFQQPLKVRPSTDGPYYYIIDGEMRYRAAQVLGRERLPCWVFDDETDARDIFLDQVVANEQRVNFQPYEIADAVKRLRDDFQMTPAAIAHETGFSSSKISRLLAIVDKIDPGVQARVRQLDDTSLTFRSLVALSQLPSVRQSSMAEVIEKQHLSAAETEAIVRRKLDDDRRPPRGIGRPRSRFHYKTRYGVVRIELDDGTGDLTDRQLYALADARRQIAAGHE